MTQQCSWPVEGEGVGGGWWGLGGEETGKAEGEKGKINTTSTLFPRHGKERGSIVGE